MSHPMVLASQSGAVLTLTLNRPEKRNALHPELVRSLTELVTEAADDDTVAVIVITGAGRAFSAGLDIDLLATWSSVDRMEYLDSAIALFRNVWDAPQPTIAAVDGPAIAGGFDLAAFCDVRLASPDAVFGQAEINLGLVQIVHPLYKSIGLGRAKELALTGMTIDAAEAYRIGLVNHVYPADQLLDRAHEMAAVMASKPRFALFETKRLTRELIDLDTAEALEQVESTFCRCLNTQDHHDRVAAFLERRRR
ncbi:MAG TPA: enoyl-CoA hydratase/isomerase family protein [Blastocatellia bacterium]|nr:enoyl-CoA hydratase/isomerase family protein [Blastocatellia bacterium]